jgi:hypothetical protein
VDVVVVGEERRALWSDDKSQVAWQRLKSNCEPDGELVPLATLPSPPFRINYAADADQSWLAFERYAQPMFYQAILHLPEGDHEQSFNGVQLSSLQWSGNVLVSTLRPIPTQVREPQNTSIVLMQGDEAFASALEIPETRSAHLSAAKGDRMLFTYSANTELFGSITERVFAQVVQIVPGSPDGGAGGAGDAGGAPVADAGGASAGEVAAGGGALDAEGGTNGELGGASIEDGLSAGGSQAGAAYAEGEGGASYPGAATRTSSACGCRIADVEKQGPRSLATISLAILIAWCRRRRVSNLENSGEPGKHRC